MGQAYRLFVEVPITVAATLVTQRPAIDPFLNNNFSNFL